MKKKNYLTLGDDFIQYCKITNTRKCWKKHKYKRINSNFKIRCVTTAVTNKKE